jgi:hypothetical protein
MADTPREEAGQALAADEAKLHKAIGNVIFGFPSSNSVSRRGLLAL